MTSALAVVPTSTCHATPQVRPTRRPRRPAAWLLALLVAGSASAAAAADVGFTLQPVDSTVVENHAITFLVRDNMDPSGTPAPSYQWYRNGAAIAGATAQYYRFSAQLGDHGAQYCVVAAGTAKSVGAVGPTASTTATLTVLPAGSALAPALTAPAGATVYLTTGATTNPRVFQAVGNDLQWGYRFDSEPADQWHALSADTHGNQAALIDITLAGATSITVRVIDDASVSATRTWALGTNQAPVISGTSATPNPVRWPGPMVVTVAATDPDGDPLTCTWALDISDAGGTVTFVPNGTSESATSSATFTKLGRHSLKVTVSDGKGGTAVDTLVQLYVEQHFDLRTDVNGDGVVNTLDLGLVVDNFGQVVP